MKVGEKRYLGDSVYCELMPDSLCLYTDNGFGPSNMIFLDGEVLATVKELIAEIEKGVTSDAR